MLRLMDRYIGKQIISATIFGVVMLCVLLVLGNLFKELRGVDKISYGFIVGFKDFPVCAFPFFMPVF